MILLFPTEAVSSFWGDKVLSVYSKEVASVLFINQPRVRFSTLPKNYKHFVLWRKKWRLIEPL